MLARRLLCAIHLCIQLMVRSCPVPPCSEKIVQGRVDKIAKTMALLEQPYIKDSGKTVTGELARWPGNLYGP